MKNIVLIICATLLISCVTTKPKDKIPPELKDMVYIKRAAAKECIESKGLNLKDRASSFEIVKVLGEKRFGNQGWGWRSPEWNNAWVLGLTYGYGSGHYTIKVGCNPNTQLEVNPETVKHEFGHYWLLSNYGLYNHDTRVSQCFDGWFDMKVKTLTIKNNDQIMIIDYIPDSEIE